MAFYDHTCEECSEWDDINGCWAGHKRGQWGGANIACPGYDGEDDEHEDFDDGQED
jgi:hypothetical protein